MSDRRVSSFIGGTESSVVWGSDTVITNTDDEKSELFNEIQRINPSVVEPYILNIYEELYGTHNKR